MQSQSSVFLATGATVGRIFTPDDAPVFTADLHVDIESRSELDLTDVGLDKYSKHPSTSILMVSWRLDEPGRFGEIQQWTCEDGTPFPQELVDLLLDPTVRKWAHNAQFERVMFREVEGIEVPIHEWRCTMVLSYMLGLPGKLETVGEVVLVPDEYLKTPGKKYIKKFSQPRKPSKHKPWRWSTKATDPEEWEEFCRYNRQDVEAECFLYYERLAKYAIDDEQWEDWFIDQEMNDYGIPVDELFINKAVLLADAKYESVWGQMKDITGLENPNSDKQFGPWVRGRGYEFGDLRKLTVQQALDDPWSSLTQDARVALDLRRQLKMTSVSKYYKTQLMMVDGRLRFQFQFSGAKRTGRTAGRGAQPQNQKKPVKWLEPEVRQLDIIESVSTDDIAYLDAFYPDTMTALSSTIRGAIRAELGYHFVAADLSAIEDRKISWLTRCERSLQAFRDGLDPYKYFGTIWLKKPYELITKDERNLCKPPKLGAGFGLGGGDERWDEKKQDIIKTGMWGYSWSLGVEMTQQEAIDAVLVYREAFPEVVQTWYAYEKAAKRAIQTGQDTICDRFTSGMWTHLIEPIAFYMEDPFLCIQLPSGRVLRYLRPRIEQKKTPWGEVRATITYEGAKESIEEDPNAFSKWERIITRGAKIFENCLGGDTLVVTDTGSKRLVEVTTSDLLWDGEGWVTHDGLISKGVSETINFGGVSLTSDHKIFAGEWLNAGDTNIEDAERAFRKHFRTPARDGRGAEIQRYGWASSLLDLKMRLRENICSISNGVQESAVQIVRLFSEFDDRYGEHQAWDVRSSSLCSLSIYGGPMSLTHASIVGELWGAWNKSLKKLARVVSEFLEGYGFDVRKRVGFGSKEQQSRILKNELPLDHSTEQRPQPQNQQIHTNTKRPNAIGRGGGAERYWHYDLELPTCSRLAKRKDVRQTGLPQPIEVYDLVNAGPNHRFTVLSGSGQPFVVHNCVQASANDLLRAAKREARKVGFQLVLESHDELLAHVRTKSVLTKEMLEDCMTVGAPWARTMPLGAVGWTGPRYKKD